MALVAIPAAQSPILLSFRSLGESGQPLVTCDLTQILTFFYSYRFRLVSISCDPNFTFSIDNHSMTVIEADGQNTEPELVDSIQIFAGRLSQNHSSR